MKTFYLRRVCYGKKDTPFNKREYRIRGFGTAVGCIDEIKKHMKKLEIYKYKLVITDDIINEKKTIYVK